MIPKEFKITKSIYNAYGHLIHDITRGWDFNDYRFDEYEFEFTTSLDPLLEKIDSGDLYSMSYCGYLYIELTLYLEFILTGPNTVEPLTGMAPKLVIDWPLLSIMLY